MHVSFSLSSCAARRRLHAIAGEDVIKPEFTSAGVDCHLIPQRLNDSPYTGATHLHHGRAQPHALSLRRNIVCRLIPDIQKFIQRHIQKFIQRHGFTAPSKKK
jgi:hypothetical protein